MKEVNDVTIIGTGAVGSALLDFFRKEQVPVRSEWNSRSGVVYSENGKKISVQDTIPQSENQIGRYVFITTPDDLIHVISEKIAALPVKWGMRNVIHCSGNLNAGELSALSEKGARTVSMHPLQTFTKKEGSERLTGISISLEGDEELIVELRALIKRMGSNPVELSREQKRALHIGAVFASNYLVALLHKTETYLEEEGIKGGLEILKPLMLQTIANILEKGPVEALTGPVLRGDVSSVQKHLDSLRGDHKTEIFYKLLGEEALRISQKRSEVDKELLQELKNLLLVRYPG